MNRVRSANTDIPWCAIYVRSSQVTFRLIGETVLCLKSNTFTVEVFGI